MNRMDRRITRNGVQDPLNALANTLLGLHPAAAFNPSGPGASRPIDKGISQVSRRGLVGGLATLLLSTPALTPSSALAGEVGEKPPTYTLSGIPGISAITGADKPRPISLGTIAQGQKLGFCDKKGCVSSFTENDDFYIPPWTYGKEDVEMTDFQRQRLEAKRKVRIEKGLDPDPPDTPKTMPVETAFSQLRTVVEEAGGRVIEAKDRYLYAEFEDSLTGVVDDVEFLFSKDKPNVGYRSAPRSGNDDKRQRTRIRDLRKALSKVSSDWKSVGRIVTD